MSVASCRCLLYGVNAISRLDTALESKGCAASENKQDLTSPSQVKGQGDRKLLCSKVCFIAELVQAVPIEARVLVKLESPLAHGCAEMCCRLCTAIVSRSVVGLRISRAALMNSVMLRLVT